MEKILESCWLGDHNGLATPYQMAGVADMSGQNLLDHVSTHATLRHLLGISMIIYNEIS